VLSVAITPAAGVRTLVETLGVPLADSGFMDRPDPHRGVFCCGTTKGPMSIADSISDADLTARQIIEYLDETGRQVADGDGSPLNQETGVDNK
jgi:heterodisulfide reductase subunit A-like polyferredoxin